MKCETNAKHLKPDQSNKPTSHSTVSKQSNNETEKCTAGKIKKYMKKVSIEVSENSKASSSSECVRTYTRVYDISLSTMTKIQ